MKWGGDPVGPQCLSPAELQLGPGSAGAPQFLGTMEGRYWKADDVKSGILASSHSTPACF